MTSDGDGPTGKEVEEQLKRILASDRFAKLPVLSPLLERLVNDSLNGRVGGKRYEIALAVEVLGKDAKNWTPLRNDVRQAMLNLRKQLDAYYKKSTDTVEIRFPKRAGFAARFSYRRASNAEEAVQRLATAFSYALPNILPCQWILADLFTCMRANPSYVPACVAYAEAGIASLICYENRDMAYALQRTEEHVNDRMELGAELWRLHVVAGAIHCCRFAWNRADAAFKTALRLAPDETQAHFWYAAFLLAVGRTEEAKQCVKGPLGKSQRARLTQYALPLVLYATRDFREAYEALLHASPSFPYVADRTAIDTGDAILGFDHWLAEILLACLCLSLNHLRAGAEYARAGVTHSKFDVFGGLPVLLEMNFARMHNRRSDGMSARTRVAKIERDGTPVSLALAYMGTGKIGEAIAQLEKACETGHPLMVWLHLWPVFDPLREDARFKALIQSMNLPLTGLAAARRHPG